MTHEHCVLRPILRADSINRGRRETGDDLRAAAGDGRNEGRPPIAHPALERPTLDGSRSTDTPDVGGFQRWNSRWHRKAHCMTEKQSNLSRTHGDPRESQGRGT